MGWGLDAGPLHVGSEGLSLRPQMRVGYSDDNCDFGAGLDNLRDGISGGIHGSVRRSYSAEGHSMVEVLKKMKAQSEIRGVDDIIRIAPQLLSQIIHMTKVDIPKNSHITAKATLKFGIGISGGICLGWADTKGFHMVGASGRVAAAASIGADIMAGLHHSRKFVKAVLGISNICVEMVFELPEPAKTGVAGKKDQEMKPEDVPGTHLAEAKARRMTLEELLEDQGHAQVAAAAAARAEEAAEAVPSNRGSDESPYNDREGHKEREARTERDALREGKVRKEGEEMPLPTVIAADGVESALVDPQVNPLGITEREKET